MPEWVQDPASDFYVIECADAEDGATKIVQIVRERIPARYGLDPIRDIQVLCPMNRGGLGARSLNIDLQQALNPPGEMRVECFGSTYGIGDKVMQVENDYDKEVYNGDLGVVRSIEPEERSIINVTQHDVECPRLASVVLADNETSVVLSRGSL
jgi:exodeoxyribonuclease V alpha subunit